MVKKIKKHHEEINGLYATKIPIGLAPFRFRVRKLKLRCGHPSHIGCNVGYLLNRAVPLRPSGYVRYTLRVQILGAELTMIEWPCHLEAP